MTDEPRQPDFDPRLIPVANSDQTHLDLVKVGYIDSAKRGGHATAEELEAWHAVLETFGPSAIIQANRALARHSRERAREHGGTIVTTRVRVRNGRVTKKTTVRRYQARTKRAPLSGRRRRTRDQRHRSRRPAARATRSSAKSGDSPDGTGDPEPLHLDRTEVER